MLLEHILRSASWVAACSQATLEHARRTVPDCALTSSVIYNGLEMPELPRMALPLDPPRILYLGRLADEKGADLAVAAMASLTQLFPSARLVIAGDGPSRRSLELLAAELGVDHAVHFVGWVAPSAVPSLMNMATLLGMPSRTEGFGLVALESALMSRPLVATQVGGLPEIVAHGETGLLVEPEDSHGLAEAVIALLQHPDQATYMGQQARRRVQQLLGLERCVDAYDALCRRLVVETVAQPKRRCAGSPAGGAWLPKRQGRLTQ
jgi:glycosyltransferase involved in cell wall biosynthesis